MATYSAVVSLNARFSAILYLYDAALPPNALKFIEFVYKELKSFGDFLERLDTRSRKRMSASLQRLTVEALEVLDDVNEYKNIIEKSNSLMETMKKTKEEYYKYSLQLIQDDDDEGQINDSSSNMVGFCDLRTELKVALIASPLVMPSHFLSLYGMAGIGKTTLARDVFEDLDISEWFECRAWVRVGLERKPQDFTEAILAQLNWPVLHKTVMEADEEEAAQRLNQLLNDKRCLVVLDDVWDNYKFNEDWYNFLGEFNENSGSRVLITSRIIHIDYTRDSRYWCPIQMRLLNIEESWNLLRDKAFAGGPCPHQLVKAGKEIAEKCDGLPLTIVTVADLLSKAQESLWNDVAAQRKHQLFVDAYDQISKVLYPSYKELIDELKLCFLYMAVFPLKSKIRRTKLINLWIAEEIFDPTVQPSELYHHDLESLKCLDLCSLLMVYENSSTYFGKPPTQPIRTCGLHSSWWHFCQREARSTNFFYVLDCPEDGLKEGIKSQTRLNIHHNVLFARKDVYKSMEENCATSAESLLCFGPYHQYEVPICFGLKLLQRLDALNIRFYDFPLEVLKLVELRYLALTCNGNLPPSISKLGRLQYLIVHPHLRTKSGVALSYMPVEIWDLEQLKHLQVMGSDLPDLGDKSLGRLSTLLDVSTASCNVLYRLPNLKKLKIRIELTPDAADPSGFSDHISNMINLESFKCIVVNPGCKFDQVVPPVASFPVLPSSLKKLSLSGMGYPWEEMREIALLPCLQQLKLRCNAFQGQNWQVEDEGFPSLYFLLLEDIDLVKLVGSFRSLKHLTINHCYKLEEIQVINYNDVSRIELVDSNPLVEKSIKTSMLVQTAFKGIILVHYSWKSARETPFRWWVNAHMYI